MELLLSPGWRGNAGSLLSRVSSPPVLKCQSDVNPNQKMHGAGAQHRFHYKEKMIFQRKKIVRKQEINSWKPGDILICILNGTS